VVVVVLAAVVVVLNQDGSDDGWTVELDEPMDSLASDDETVCGSAGAVDSNKTLSCWHGSSGDELFEETVGHEALVLSVVDQTLLAVDGVTFGGDTMSAFSFEGDLLWDVDWDRVLHDGQMNISHGPFVYADDPAVADGVLLTRPEDPSAEVVGVDITDGHELWRTSITPPDGDPEFEYASSAVAAHGTFYVTRVVNGPSVDELATQLVAIEADSGDELWRWTMQADVADGDITLDSVSRVAVVDDGDALAVTVWVDGQWRAAVLDAETGDLRWETETRAFPDIAFAGDVLVVFSGSELYGYSPEGEELWVSPAPGQAREHSNGKLLTAGDHLYFLDVWGEVYAIDLVAGDSQVIVDERTTHAAAAGGHLVAATDPRHGRDPSELHGRPLDDAT
jgi:outer membrane protein assembly factor BamB